jgi:hypothetical protein
MPVKQWNPGDVLAAADLDAWAVPLAVVKPSGQTVTGSTAYVNDTALVLPVAANQFYLVEAVIQYNATSGGDFKWTFTVPAGATGFYGGTYSGLSGFTGGASNAWTDTGGVTPAQGQGTGTFMDIRLRGVLNVAGTLGNLQFRFAQNTASGTTTVMANSALVAQMIG